MTVVVTERPALHRRRRSWIAAAFAVGLALAVAQCHAAGAASALPGKVQDLDYGDVLFHFYQDDLFGALVRLEVASDFKRMSHHAAEAELLSGGLYLSLGMHLEATRVFDRLLAGDVPASVNDRARFYLARIDYQRGYYAEAERNLGAIGAVLPSPLESERRLLAANVLMAQSRYDEAARLLEGSDLDGDWLAYARFNLGVALARAGRPADAQRWLEAVGTMLAVSDDQRSLRDRANLALGYSMLQQQAAETAAGALARVRLDGPFTSKALLGLGWAESDAHRPDRALVPWLELRSGRLLDAAVQESYLAVPYAYAQLASNGEAAQQYRVALDAFAVESRRIDESIATIRKGGFPDAILDAAPHDEMPGWFWQLSSVPDAPQTRYLYHLLASHEFQEGLKNYRDLRLMRRNLDAWRTSLDAFDEMIATREEASARREAQRERSPAAAELDGLAGRQSELEQRLAAIAAGRDVAALANGAELAQWQALERATTRIAALPAGAERDGLEQRAAWLRGLLFWQLDAAYRSRLMGLEADLRSTSRLLAAAQGGRAGVEHAAEVAPRATGGFAARAGDLAIRIDAIDARIERASRAQEQVLAATAIAELEAQKRRLASYATQAQFALASLYDGAATRASR